MRDWSAKRMHAIPLSPVRDFVRLAQRFIAGVARWTMPSPVGTTDAPRGGRFSRPYGTNRSHARTAPAINRWAKFKCPYRDNGLAWLMIIASISLFGAAVAAEPSPPADPKLIQAFRAECAAKAAAA